MSVSPSLRPRQVGSHFERNIGDVYGDGSRPVSDMLVTVKSRELQRGMLRVNGGCWCTAFY